MVDWLRCKRLLHNDLAKGITLSLCLLITITTWLRGSQIRLPRVVPSPLPTSFSRLEEAYLAYLGDKCICSIHRVEIGKT